jgi:DNA repair protein RadA
MSYRTGLEILREHQANPKLSTGNLELDSLLAGGIENGTFNVLYGDDENTVDQILYTLLCNCQLPIDKYGLNGKAVLLSCGNYHEEQALVDLKLTTSLLQANGIDPAKGLDEIIAVSAFNADQAVKSVEDTVNVVRYHDQVRLVVIRNLPKLFTADPARSELSLERTQQLQHLLVRLWQACSERQVTLIASCRPRRPFSIRPTPPEGGVFLRHLAQVILCFKKTQDGGLTAFLLKHPKRQPRSVEFRLNQSDSVMGGVTVPFRSQLQQEVENLTRSFKEALMEPARRDAFDSLQRAWTAEQGAMSYAKVPSVLEVMLLTAAVDNRKTIEDLQDQVAMLRSQLQKAQSELTEAKIAFKTLPSATE